jgi:tape measure domain-containing protein
MSTLSTNQIVVEYIIKEGDIRKAQQDFDKLTEAEKRAILETKNLNDAIRKTSDESKKLGDQFKKTTDEGVSGSTKTETALKAIAGPIRQNREALSAFTSQLKVAGDAATAASNKASAGFAGLEAKQRSNVAAANAFRASLGQVNTTLETTSKTGKKATEDVAGGMKNIGGIVDGLGPMIQRAFAGAALIEFTKKIFTTTAAFEGLRTTIDYATEGQQENGKAFQYLTNLANTYGKDLQSLAGTYSSFTASSNLAGIKLEESNKIFEAAVKASTALGKSNEDTQGILLAFSQIVSKGTVQAEELRGQIGERIPGAFNLAAKAMGVTTRELNKMLEQGQVISADFLPKFAVELENAFGDAANKKMNSMTATLGRFTTAWSRFLESPAISKYLAETVNLATVSLDKVRKLTLSESEKKAEDAARIESNITTNLKTELAERLKTIQDNTNKNATMDQVVLQKYTETLAYRDQLMEKTVNLRIQSAGSMNKAALNEAETQLEYTNIVLEALDKEVKGFEVTNNKKVELTEKEKKALEDAKKKEYQLRLQNLERLKQIREIELTLQGVPEAGLIAEKEFLNKKYNLQLEYFGKVKELTQTEIKLTEKQAEKSLFDLKQYYEGLKMVNKTATADFAKDNTKALDAEQDAGIIRMKNWSKMYEANLADEVKAKQKAEEEKAQATQIYYDIAANSVQSLFDIQQQNIQNEITLLNRKYSEEIRLAGDNQQKVLELKQKQEAEEKALRRKAFEAQRMAAVSQVIFNVAPIIAQHLAKVVTAPLAIAAYASAAAQIGFILAQPVPEFKEGTKGKPFKGGKAIVGEIGKEWVVTTSGQVYETPGVATLVDLPKGSQVIPHHEVIKSERFMGSKLMNQGRGESGNGHIVSELISIKETLSKLPITSLTMDERGFTKKIQTKSRETRILNNRFGN